MNWMNESNDLLRGTSHSIDDFVKRNESLKVITKQTESYNTKFN